MKTYNTKIKPVEIGTRRYDGIFPENHSRIESIVYQVTNLSDPLSKRPIKDYHTLCMVKEKGKDWRTEYCGPSNLMTVQGMEFMCQLPKLEDILFVLESFDEQKKYFSDDK